MKKIAKIALSAMMVAGVATATTVAATAPAEARVVVGIGLGGYGPGYGGYYGPGYCDPYYGCPGYAPAYYGGYYGPGGLGELRGVPGQALITPQARVAATAARLWDVSETLTGVSFS